MLVGSIGLVAEKSKWGGMGGIEWRVDKIGEASRIISRASAMTACACLGRMAGRQRFPRMACSLSWVGSVM